MLCKTYWLLKTLIYELASLVGNVCQTNEDMGFYVHRPQCLLSRPLDEAMSFLVSTQVDLEDFWK